MQKPCALRTRRESNACAQPGHSAAAHGGAAHERGPIDTHPAGPSRRAAGTPDPRLGPCAGRHGRSRAGQAPQRRARHSICYIRCLVAAARHYVTRVLERVRVLVSSLWSRTPFAVALVAAALLEARSTMLVSVCGIFCAVEARSTSANQSGSAGDASCAGTALRATCTREPPSAPLPPCAKQSQKIKDCCAPAEPQLAGRGRSRRERRSARAACRSVCAREALQRTGSATETPAQSEHLACQLIRPCFSTARAWIRGPWIRAIASGTLTVDVVAPVATCTARFERTRGQLARPAPQTFCTAAPRLHRGVCCVCEAVR